MPHVCWFWMWECNGLPPIRCFVHYHYIYSYIPGLWNVGCTLDYHDTINSFVSRNKDLHALELSNTDWKSIKLVASWLKSFRSATMEISTTKLPMLSMTHAIFWGLQDDIKDILCSLPNSISPRIKLSLTDAHRKLSDYYYQYDASPFYTWAACKWGFNWNHFLSDWQPLVLDPCISYEGLKVDYGDDLTLTSHLEESKTTLFNYFDENYATLPCLTPSSPPPMPVQALPMDGLPQKSFMARYHRRENHPTNELEEYFKLPAEDFNTCNPIQWWVGQQSQFLHLFQLAHDILCIPG